jgi:hypothetical protein
VSDTKYTDAELDALMASLPTVQAENEQALISAGVDPESVLPSSDLESNLDADVMADMVQDIELERQYGDSPVATTALGAADMATFSLSGRALDKLGLVSKETQEQLRTRNPGADVAGQVLGVVAPALLTGGLSTAAQVGTKGAITAGAKALTAPAIKAGLATEKLVANALKKAIAESGSKTVAKKVLQKGVEKAAGGAVEGSVIGLSQMLREEHLGDAEFNAENLMATIGTGALYGGLIGGALPVVGAPIKWSAGKVGSAGKKVFDKVLSKYADPKKAAEELTGMNLGTLAKLESKESGKALLKELPDWYANEVKIGIGDGAEEILEKVKATRSEAGLTIGRVLEQADMEAAQLGKQMPPTLRADLFNGVAQQLDDDFLKPLTTGLAKDTLKAEASQVANIIKGLRREATTGEALNAKALVNAKRGIDKIIKKFKNRPLGTSASDAEMAAVQARSLLNEASKRYVTFINPQLADELARANKNYQFAMTVEPHLLRKSLKDPSMVSFKDALYGLAGIGVGGGPLGAGVVLGKKFLESDLRRKLLIMNGIETANMGVTSQIAKSATQFLDGARRPARLASLAALTNSPIAQKREEGKRSAAPKNRLDAYKNASENISKLVTQSDELMDRSVKAGAAIAYAAPQTAELVGNRAISAIQFLQSQIPKRPYEAIFPTETQKPYEPSSMELAKFERYIQVVDNPLSVLQDLEAGTLTQDHVKALKAVYPRMYSEIKQSVLAGLQSKAEADVPYSKKVQISILFGVPVDASLIGRNIAGMQAMYGTERAAQETGAQGGQASGAARSSVDPAKSAARVATDTQSFIARRNK